MKITPWVFGPSKSQKNKIIGNTREKIALFLCLWARETDYGYNIAAQFKHAQKKGFWDSTGSANIIHPNKINSILREMWQCGLLRTLDEKRALFPSLSYPSVPAGEGRSRLYYTINHDVLICPYKIELSADDRATIIRYLRTKEGPAPATGTERPRPILDSIPSFEKMHFKILRENMSDLELWMYFREFGGNLADDELSGRTASSEWPYPNYHAFLRLVELHKIPFPKIISYINNLDELDYLTLLVTGLTFAEEILQDYGDSSLIQHYRNSQEEGVPPFPKDDDERLKQIFKKNQFFTSFKKLEQICAKTQKEFNPPGRPVTIHAEDALPFRMLMETNIVTEVLRARSLHGKKIR